MILRFWLAFALFFVGVAPGFALVGGPKRVSYEVSVASATASTYRVTVRAEGLPPDATEVGFAIPAWSPGWYVLSDYQNNISEVTASQADGAPLIVAASGTRTWRVSRGVGDSVTLRYNLRAPDTGFGFFEPYLDSKNGFVPGPSSLMYVVGATQIPCVVSYKVPENWKVVSGNDPVDGAANTFSAPSYDILADHPADLGTFRRYERTIAGVPISIVIVGGDGIDATKWVERTFKIAAAGIKVFGGTPPFPRYVFQFRFTDTNGFFGGLEHLNSTVLRLSPEDLRRADPENMTIVAHEFVHAWNVKRLRPAVLGPFDYARSVAVKDLWWLEGVTDYFAPRILVEAGLAGRDYWLGYMGGQINELQNNPGRRVVTLEETGARVWEAGNSEGIAGLSYYNKGLVVGLLLDIEMQRVSQNKVGVVDIVKSLMARVASSGKGYAPGELEKTASKLAGSDLSSFFETSLRTTSELDVSSILPAAGIAVETEARFLPTLGIQWDFVSGGAGSAVIAGVVKGGPAQKAGLLVGDRVTGVDNRPLDALFGAPFASRRAGDSVTLIVVRDGISKRVPVIVATIEERTYRLSFTPNPTAAQRATRTKIVGGG